MARAFLAWARLAAFRALLVVRPRRIITAAIIKTKAAVPLTGKTIHTSALLSVADGWYRHPPPVVFPAVLPANDLETWIRGPEGQEPEMPQEGELASAAETLAGQPVHRDFERRLAVTPTSVTAFAESPGHRRSS
jgi:hypothetical protein